MYQKCCRKCASTSMHTEQKGNNIGLYCDDCGAWVTWFGKDELRAFKNSQKENINKDNSYIGNEDVLDSIITISEPDEFKFKTLVESHIKRGYKISSTHCCYCGQVGGNVYDCESWMAIMIKE